MQRSSPTQEERQPDGSIRLSLKLRIDFFSISEHLQIGLSVHETGLITCRLVVVPSREKKKNQMERNNRHKEVGSNHFASELVRYLNARDATCMGFGYLFFPIRLVELDMLCGIK